MGRFLSMYVFEDCLAHSVHINRWTIDAIPIRPIATHGR